MGALTGCARAIGGGGSDAQDRAMDDARKKAGQVVDAIDRDYVYKADGYAHSAAQVDGVEVMKVDGTLRNSGDGVTLVIRVHGTAPAVNGSGPVDLPVCFRFTYDRDRSGRPQDQVGCPSTPPIDIPKDPKLPRDILDTLRRTLPSGPNATEADVRAVVDGLNLDPRVHRDVKQAHGAIGVALQASQFNCVLARVTPDKVEVWIPSRIQLAPGELSCAGAVAAGGGGQTAPH